eukprot:symbB.v1.2.004563.t1/scaffold239.1/size255824/6
MAGSVIKQEKSHRTLARCSIPLAEVLEDSKPMARKLYSPLGQGPFEELQDAQLLLSFSTAFGDRLNINIMSVKGMQTSITKPMYVRATCRQNCASNVGGPNFSAMMGSLEASSIALAWHTSNNGK